MLAKSLFTRFLGTETGAAKLDRVLGVVKRLALVTTTLDATSGSMVSKFLHAKCTRIYSSHGFNIQSRWVEVVHADNVDLVFYKIPTHDSLFLYKGTLLELAGDRQETGLQIKSLRGTVDLAELLKEAREFARPKASEDTNHTVNFRRFGIYEYYGTTIDYNRGYPKVAGNSRGNVLDGGAQELIAPENVPIYPSDEPLNYRLEDLSVAPRVSCPFDDLYFPEEVLSLVRDTEEWLKRSGWFKSRGLPWKRGILLYGPGGTGKSSFYRALGKKFGIPIHQIYMAKMSDQEFKQAYENAVTSAPSIVLLEDIDTVFKKRVPVDPKCELSFDTVLNTISGVKNSDGVILGVTTNHIEDVDDAFGAIADLATGRSTRPGRIDRILYLGEMNEENRLKLITKILKDWPDLIEVSLKETQRFTPGQVQEYCIQQALHRLQEKGFT